MSMLAEPRRKQKWSLNPRGKQWSEDSSKFGQRMLEKMGWSSGKGLGANEQGATGHVRVSLKNDMGGIGFNNDNMDKAWTEHQDSFNEFLQKLQQGDNHNIVQTEEKKSELSGKSLELKSKQSRARVHYQKFTRGKDINKYSSKDLANIFGQKELNVNKSDKHKQEDDKGSFDAIGTQDNRGGVITINGGNMNEYFKKKNHTFPLTSVSEKQQKNDSESEPEYAGFGFASTFGRVKSRDTEENKDTQNVCSYAFENPCVQLDSPENISNSNDKAKPSRKRKSSDDSELSSSIRTKKMKENGIVNDALNIESQADEICNGKEFEVSRVEFGVTNSALDLSDEVDDKKRVTFNDHVEYSTDPVKKKKGRTTLDKFEVENKKSKKKKKHDSTVSNSVSSGFVNEALDVVETADEVNDNEINERKSKKSKKRKGSRRSNLETIVEIPEEDKVCENGTETKRDKVECNTSNDCMSQDTVSKKIKKKKHKEKTEVVAKIEENVKEILKEEKMSPIHENGDCEIREDQEDICKKKKKKKKKNKDKDIESNIEKNENVISEIQIKDNNTESIEEERAEVETVKVKKKNKSKKDDVNDVSTKTEIMEVKEISDKENTKNANETKIEKSKQEEYKQLENEPTINNITHNKGFTQKSTTETNRVRNRNTSNRFNRKPNISSPWNNGARMSKRLLMSLFHRNSVANFPGSNIDEIKGYGADVQ